MKKWLLSFILFMIGFLIPVSASSDKLDIRPEDFLTSKKYHKLEIEILYTAGCEPDKDSIAFLSSQILHYCHKETVQIFQYEISLITSNNISKVAIFPVFSGIWFQGNLANFKNRFSQLETHSDILVLHILYVPGIPIDDPAAIGEAFAFDSFVVFKPRIQISWEKGVLLHELGHIFGLVDHGSKVVKDHRDSLHPAHCSNAKCAMFWCIDDTDRLFDEDCRNDLYAAGAKKFY